MCLVSDLSLMSPSLLDPDDGGEDQDLQRAPHQGHLPRPQLRPLDHVVAANVDDVHQHHQHYPQHLLTRDPV